MARTKLEYKRRAARARARRRNLTAGAIALAVIAVGALAYVLARTSQPVLGEAIPLMPANHVPEGEDPGRYNSDPPTSGPHYDSEWDAGFYDEDDLQSAPQFPEGYLVHNLEHGYVIFWYNCTLLSAADCLDLKEQLRALVEKFDAEKVIVFPRPSMTVPVAATSWGRLLKMEAYDPKLAEEFVRRNRNHAPEPNAP